MSKTKFSILNRQQAQEFSDWLGCQVIPENGFTIEVKERHKQRSLSQNALFWMWMHYLVGHNMAKDESITQDDWHDYFVHLFLGWTECREVGSVKIEPTLKKTRFLNQQEMTDFMQKIEVYCAERKVYLPIPENALYLKYRYHTDGGMA